MDRGELEGLDRESLVVRAQAAGIRRARILTRPELIDELLRLDPSGDEGQLRRSRGFFGRARDLVARVVERGLHLPDAADRIRELAGAEVPYATPRIEPQAMPTVTLAEIYAAQGHDKRAIETLRRVLEREPDHAAAQTLLARLEDEAYIALAPPLPPEPEMEIDLNAAGDDEDESMGVALDEVETGTPARHFVAGPAYAVVAADDKDVDALADTGAVAMVSEADDEDECFAIPLGDGRMFVRWRVAFTAIGVQLGARPAGHFVVRAHVVVPSWDGPLAETRDRTVAPDADEVLLEGLPHPSVVRIAVGWLDGETFVPMAHSPALEPTATHGLAIWTRGGPVAIVLDDPRAAPIALALERSRRLTEARE